MGLHPRLQRRAPKWHSDRPGPPRPCRLVSSRGTPFPSPLPDGGAPTRPGCCCPSLGEPPGASGSLGSGRLADPAPRSPFRFRSALGTTPPGPSLSGPGSHPGPRSPCPVLTPHPVHVGRHGRSRRRLRPHNGPGRLGGRLGPRRRPGAGLAPRGSLGRARAAGTAAASAVAAHLRPQRRAAATAAHAGRRGPGRRSASSGTSSAAAVRSRFGPCPRGAAADVGPAASASPPPRAPSADGRTRRALGSGRRARPRRSATSGSRSAASGPPRPALGYFRGGSAPPPGAGEERA